MQFFLPRRLLASQTIVYSLLFLFLISVTPVATYAAELAPFTTDGCSMFPDGSGKDKELWLSCCEDHDLSYWRGGSEVQRRVADESLEQCVTAKGFPKLAALMFVGVLVGGSPFLPTPFRWGYGWPYLRGYKALSNKEEAEVARKLVTGRQSPSR